MALRIRRGTELERLTVVFAEGEIVYATDTKRLYVGDGVTAGGIAVADLLTDSSPQLGNTLDLNSHDIIGFGNINIQGDITATGTLTIPTIITDVQGSIFGDDSTPLVDGANSKLVLNNNSINDLKDVDINIIYLDQILKWNGTYWSNVDYTLGALTNVDTAGILDTQIIQWNSQNSSWFAADYTLRNLTDVDFTSGIATGKTIRYDQQVQAWLPIDFKLESLDDVDIPGIVSGDLLRYDGSKFVPYILTLSTNDLTDVISDSVATGDILQYDGTHFVPGTLPAGSFNLLSDVDINDPQVGETIIWDGASWINTAGPGDIFQTDVQGSVFGLDSTIIVDGGTHEINASKLSTDIIQATNNTLTVSSTFITNFRIETLDNRSRLLMVNKAANPVTDLSAYTGYYGTINFGYEDDINGENVRGTIRGSDSDIRIAHDLNEGLLSDETKYLTIKDGAVGIGTYTPEAKLDVRGPIKPGVYADTAARDAAVPAPVAGMIVFLTDGDGAGNPKFQGNTDGTTNGWVNLNN